MTSDVLPNRSPSGPPDCGTRPATPDSAVGAPDHADPVANTDPIADYLEHATTAPARRRRLPVITLVLLAGVIAAAAFTAGLITQNKRVENQTAVTGPSGFPDFAASGGRFSGGGQLPEGFTPPEGIELPGAATGAGASDTSTATAPATVGAVTAEDPTVAGEVLLVDSGNLYVEIGVDAPVKVVVSDTTTVVDPSDPSVTSPNAVKTGDHVIVDGTRTADNDLDATTVVVAN